MDVVPVAAPAVEMHENVEEPLAAIGLGEKPKVTPEMGGEADSDTLPLKPLSAVSETVNAAVPPAVIEIEPGLAPSVKSGLATGLIVSDTLVVWTSVPSVPVIVMDCGPVGAPALVVTVSVDEPLGAMGLGAKAYATPVSAGEADSEMLLP